MVRAVEFSNRVDGVMSLYKDIFLQKKKQRQQLPITMFFSKVDTLVTLSAPPSEESLSEHEASSPSPPILLLLTESSYDDLVLISDDEALLELT